MFRKKNRVLSRYFFSSTPEKPNNNFQKHEETLSKNSRIENQIYANGSTCKQTLINNKTNLQSEEADSKFEDTKALYKNLRSENTAEICNAKIVSKYFANTEKSNAAQSSGNARKAILKSGKIKKEKQNSAAKQLSRGSKDSSIKRMRYSGKASEKEIEKSRKQEDWKCDINEEIYKGFNNAKIGDDLERIVSVIAVPKEEEESRRFEMPDYFVNEEDLGDGTEQMLELYVVEEEICSHLKGVLQKDVNHLFGEEEREREGFHLQENNKSRRRNANHFYDVEEKRGNDVNEEEMRRNYGNDEEEEKRGNYDNEEEEEKRGNDVNEEEMRRNYVNDEEEEEKRGNYDNEEEEEEEMRGNYVNEKEERGKGIHAEESRGKGSHEEREEGENEDNCINENEEERRNNINYIYDEEEKRERNVHKEEEKRGRDVYEVVEEKRGIDAHDEGGKNVNCLHPEEKGNDGAELNVTENKIGSDTKQRPLLESPGEEMNKTSNIPLEQTPPDDPNSTPCTPPGALAPLWSPPQSPHCLIEEELYHNPWGLLVATIFLTRTKIACARQYLDQFLKDFPGPRSVIEKRPEDLEKYFVNIGLKKRAEHVWKMSQEFLNKPWKNARELTGIGKYGEDAFRLFCLGDLDVQPNDRYLRIYQAWFKEYFGSVSDVGGEKEKADYDDRLTQCSGVLKELGDEGDSNKSSNTSGCGSSVNNLGAKVSKGKCKLKKSVQEQDNNVMNSCNVVSKYFVRNTDSTSESD